MHHMVHSIRDCVSRVANSAGKSMLDILCWKEQYATQISKDIEIYVVGL